MSKSDPAPPAPVPPGAARPASHGVRLWLGAGAVFVAVLSLMLVTRGDVGLTWDEGDHIMRIQRVHDWMQQLWHPRHPFDRDYLLSPAGVQAYWKFAREEPHGHPPFYAVLGYAGWLVQRAVAGGDGASLVAYRTGPCIEFALMTAVVFLLLARAYGAWAGVAAAGAMVLIPRLFAHGHFINTDCSLMFMWTLTVALFAGAMRSLTCAILFGVCIGLCAVTKLTGWFVAAPLLVWTGVYRVVPAVRDRFRARRPAELLVTLGWCVLMGGPLAVTLWIAVDPHSRPVPGVRYFWVPAAVWTFRWIVCAMQARGHWLRRRQPALEAWLAAIALAPLAMWLATPNFWHGPAVGLDRFLQSNLTRGQTIAIGTWYLGRFYPFSLPWHNTLVLTVATVPLGVLLLSAVGGVRTIAGARRDPFGMLVLLNAVTLLVLRAMPNVPGHDGVRQFVTAFVFIGMLAGIGVHAMVGWIGRAREGARSRWYHVGVPAVAALLVVGGAVQSVLIHPYELAYYSETVGSLPGARRLGLETTYYWDTISPEMLDWLNAHTRPTKVATPTYVRGWAKLHPWGLLAPHVTFEPVTRAEIVAYLKLAAAGRADDWQPRPFDYYLLQMRQGNFSMYDRALVDGGVEPEFDVTRFGVPLVAVYRFADLPPDAQQHMIRRQRALLEQIRSGQLGGPKW